MTTWFVSRHPGAVEWAGRHAVRVDRQVAHLDAGQVAAGDVVIGVLPVYMAARICARGAKYLNLLLEVPFHLRGTELSADQLEALGARLQTYRVTVE